MQLGLRNMAIGGVICIIGILVTAGTYGAASSGSGGGHYVIAWGAIVFGGFQFLKGLFQMVTGSGSQA
ncbi:MAG TPA: hypothetical protein VKX28_00400 [Xanthobacteraceae bacterium]|nr:hypothetical protein [Xanthobacteraceae bacterium]